MLVTNENLLKQIDSFIESNKDDILIDLMDLVRIPSVRSEAKEDAPFGENCRVMLEKTAELYDSHGFKSRFDKNNRYIISEFENDGKTIGVFSHGDVVTAEGEWLICPPFEPVIKDGYMFGRGCNDDKSGIIQALYAAKFIRESGLDFKSNLLMYTGANEESGMADIKEFAKNEAMPEVSIVPDGEYPCWIGERSIIRFSATSNNKFNKIKDFCGGSSYNIVLGEVTAKIEYNETLLNELENKCKDDNKFIINKDENDIIITAKGKSAHTISVSKGLNAAKLLADLLLGCDNVTAQDKAILKTISAFICDGYGSGFNIEHEDKAFGRLICSNGIVYCEQGNITATFDIRAGTSLEIEDIQANILNACEKAEFTADFSRASKGYLFDEDDKTAKLICDTYHYIVKPDAPLTPKLTAAGTYARQLKNAFPIGTIDYTKAHQIELPEGHGGVHQPDEKLHVKGFLEAIKILICILLEADKLINS